MKRIAILLVLLIGLATTSAARSQQPDTPSKAKASARDDSVSFKPSPELQKSLQDLALAVQSLAQRIASDPEIKAAAVRVASGLVTTTQQVVEEESGAIQQALKSAADKIAAAQSVPPEHPRKP